MAKKSQQSSNKTVVGGLSAVFIILVALIAQYFFGIDVLNIDEEGTDNNEASVVDTSVSGDWYDLYFTNPLNTNDRSKHVGAEVEAALLAVINGAQRSIDGALYELNMESLTDAFIAARQRGVQVRLVMDDKDAVEDEDSTVADLEDAGWVVYCNDNQPARYDIRCDDRGVLMHNKFLIIDGASVWMGSMNFTHNGIYNNSNNAMYLRSSRLAQNYQSEFDEMFLKGIFTRSADEGNLPNRNLTIGGVQVETYFSPEDGQIIEDRVAELINGAQTSVYFMTNIVTLDSLGTAAINRFNNQVDVKAIFESRGSTDGQMVPMGCAGIPVKQDPNPNTFHHKVIIIDGSIVITGSYNFSASARDNNSENVLIFHSPELAQAFTNEFFRWFNNPSAPVPDLECS